MHIPDGFLSPGVSATAWVVAGAGIAAALQAERRETEPMPAGILGSMAAFLFAAQMVNVPVAPGTSGHLVGATLAAAILGPWRAVLAISAVLAVQALVFQDGGILAYGANFTDMGLAGCFVGYAVARIVSRGSSGPRRIVAGAIMGAFAATVAGAVGVSLWLSLSGLYPLGGILPVMLVTHVGIGLLESSLTGAILVPLLRWRPDLAVGFAGAGTRRRTPSLAVGVFGTALAVAAFVSPFASVLPDGLETAARRLGFASRARTLWPGLHIALVAPVAAGVLGTVAAAALAWAVSRGLAAADDDAHG
jgi:cobalt/nickel transport system permease protein